MTWSYVATRITGPDRGSVVHGDLPLTGVSLSTPLSGPWGMTAQVTPGPDLLDGGQPVLQEWSTAVWAVESGLIRGGGILVRSTTSGGAWSLECTGYGGYPQGIPYGAEYAGVDVDPADVFRHVWEHLQAQPDGDLGVLVDATTTPVRVGQPARDVEFTTGAGEQVAFESGPYKLSWWEAPDCGDALARLAADTPFDWVEEHAFDGDSLVHRVRVGYPRLGRRRTDLRFVLGENLTVDPEVTRDGDEYANEVLCLGAGQGRDMVRATVARRDGRARRVRAVVDKTAKSATSARAAATRELAVSSVLTGVVTDVTVWDHPNAPVGSWSPGDEVLLLVPQDLGEDVTQWCRVVDTTIRPDSPGVAALSLVRS